MIHPTSSESGAVLTDLSTATAEGAWASVNCLLVDIGSRAPYPLPEIYCLQQLTMNIPAKILCEYGLNLKILKTNKLPVARYQLPETDKGRSSFELCPYF
jgi:hypothetical protein